MTRLVLGRAPLAVTAAAAGWLLAALPLLLLGVYRPVVAGPACLAAALALGWFAARRTPDLDGPAWAGWLTLVVVAGFLALAWGWSGEHVIVRRDAGSYALYAQWLAAHGRLPIPGSAAVFGPGAQLAAPGFYGVGGMVVPQFLSGAPLLLAVGGWLAGLPGILHADAVIGAAGVLAVAGLAARVVGVRAAPYAALVAGLSYPVLHAARSPYSEPLALLLLFGGLALLAERRLLLLGGLLVGLATLARVDTPADLLLLAPYAVLVAGRRAVAAGLALGVAAGLLDGILLSRPYLASVAEPLLGIGGVLLALTAVGFAVRRFRRPGWLPPVAAALVLLVALGLWLRPLVQTVRRPNPAVEMIGTLQRQQGLPFDPTRTYDEQALHWVSWWIGGPLLVLAVAGLALLVRRRLAGDTARYDAGPFLLVLVAAAGLVLYRPSITPDHPWADRRFVPVLLPGLAICAAYALARLRRRWLAAGLGGLVLVPLLYASGPLLDDPTERGELAVLQQVCASLPAQAAVVVTGLRAPNEWPQVLRGPCGTPAAVVPSDRLAATLPAVRQAVRAAGRRLVVLSAEPKVLTAAGLSPTLVADRTIREDQRLLTRRPGDTLPVRIEVWTASG